MKKKNILYTGFIAAVLLLGLILSLGMLVCGPSRAGANEQLSPKPTLVRADGSWNPDFLGDCVTWFSDHFFLRQELISLHNLISAKVLGTSGADSVILGRNGWLYYADTLADYSYSNAMTEQEIFAAANNLRLMEDYCLENGSRFLFALTPNKNSLYPMNMPVEIPYSSRSNQENLFASLEEMNVAYADLFAAFRAEDEILYFAHDSHWDSKGAALGADVINQGFGRESSYYWGAFQWKNHQGDLYAMLYPAFQDPEEDQAYRGGLEFTYTGSGKKPDSITLETAGTGEGKLLAYRDSFGNLLYPYLAESFGEALFSRSTVYDLTVPADYVLIQLVERNIPYLITYVPVMPSPAVEIALPENAGGTVALETGKGKTPEGYVQLRGLAADAVGTVYVVCGAITYEAFLLREGEFAVNVPVGATAEAIVYATDSGVCLLNVQ